MSKAEEQALKAYLEIVRSNYSDTIEGYEHYLEDGVVQGLARKAFQEGFEKAEKYLKIEVKRWLAEIHRVCDITDENGYRIELRDLVASFEREIEK